MGKIYKYIKFNLKLVQDGGVVEMGAQGERKRGGRWRRIGGWVGGVHVLLI